MVLSAENSPVHIGQKQGVAFMLLLENKRKPTCTCGDYAKLATILLSGKLFCKSLNVASVLLIYVLF